MWKEGFQMIYFLLKLITVVISNQLSMEKLITTFSSWKIEIACNQYV